MDGANAPTARSSTGMHAHPAEEATAPPASSSITTFTFEDALLVVTVDILQQLDGHYGLFLWPCARALAHYIWRHRTRLNLKAESHVLELGAGTGLPGILAAKLGARVVLTDAGDRSDVLANLHHVSALNGVCCHVAALPWGWAPSAMMLLQSPPSSSTPKSVKCSSPHSPAAAAEEEPFDIVEKHPDMTEEPFDIILGADVLYASEDFEDLFATVYSLLRLRQGSTRFITAYQQRSLHHSLEFLLCKWGLQVTHLALPPDFMSAENVEMLGGAAIIVAEIQLSDSIYPGCVKPIGQHAAL